jgi:hypothetical protein
VAASAGEPLAASRASREPPRLLVPNCNGLAHRTVSRRRATHDAVAAQRAVEIELSCQWRDGRARPACHTSRRGCLWWIGFPHDWASSHAGSRRACQCKTPVPMGWRPHLRHRTRKARSFKQFPIVFRRHYRPAAGARRRSKWGRLPMAAQGAPRNAAVDERRTTWVDNRVWCRRVGRLSGRTRRCGQAGRAARSKARSRPRCGTCTRPVCRGGPYRSAESHLGR